MHGLFYNSKRVCCQANLLNREDTMKGRHDLFANEHQSVAEQMRALTKACVERNPILVSQILNSKPMLMNISGPIFDKAGLRYTKITIFQYALHNRAEPLKQAILDVAQESDQAVDLLRNLKRQCQQYIDYGVQYSLNGESIKEIIDASQELQAQLVDISAREDQLSNRMDKCH